MYRMCRENYSVKEISNELGGISTGTIYLYIGRGEGNMAMRRKMNVPEPPDDIYPPEFTDEELDRIIAAGRAPDEEGE
jgi:hypothetical protein